MALTKVTGSVIKDSVSLSGNVSVGGTLTYQDVTNVDALGIGTFRTGIKVLAGQVDVGSNIKLGNAGVITATSFVGNGAITINNNADNRVITGSGSANTLEGESALTFSGQTLSVYGAAGDPGRIDIKEGGAVSRIMTTRNSDTNGDLRFFTEVGGSLAVRAKINYSGDFEIPDKIVHEGDTNTAIRFPAADTITFETTGGERLRIDNNGNIGVNCIPSTSGGAGTLYGTVDHFIAIGDSDTGIAQDGDGQLELWANNEEIASFNTGQVTLKKVTQINNSIGVGILPQTSGSGSQFGARTYKICIGDNDTGIAQNGDGNLCFYSNNEEIIRIDSSISGVVKNNFLQKEFQRHDTSSQHGPLGSSFSTDGTISATISNYQRGQRIVIRATVPTGIALNNGSGANYASTTVRIKLSNGSNSTYSNDRASWYRADGAGTHETTQNVFICLYLTESNTDFNNGDTLTVTLEGKKSSGAGASTHYLGGWSTSKELTIERYERAL